MIVGTQNLIISQFWCIGKIKETTLWLKNTTIFLQYAKKDHDRIYI